jgi:hypothetical protein
MGGGPTQALLGDCGPQQNLHGTVSKSPYGWVVPSFHPAHLIRGAHKLTGTVVYDLSRAFDIAENGWVPDEPLLHLDPSVGFFKKWAQVYLDAVKQDPENVWLSVDVETPDKERKLDEGELKSVDRSMEITRINLSYDPDEGLTVPAVGPYLTIVGAMLKSAGPKWYWNKAYDLKRLYALFGSDGLRGPQLDGMDGWHALHSDVPKGLGFVAPFYSRWGPWKHLSASSPVLYGAGDGLQNQRCVFGVARDLQERGMWDVFWRHMHEVGVYATSPSAEVGLKVDRKQVEGMREVLRKKTGELYDEMQGMVPEEIRPLHPPGGWKKDPGTEEVVYPKEGEEHSRARPLLTIDEEAPIKVCRACNAQQVSIKHRCKTPEGKLDKDAKPDVIGVVRQVPRFYVRRDFNPGSWQQVLAYIKHCGHRPGKEKGRETTNRDTIERLADSKPRNKKDEARRELYHLLMDFRDLKKVLGTYVEGTLRRLDYDLEQGITDGRLHPSVTNNPSTLRTAYNNPNLQNVVADRRGKESLAAGFRKCLVAEPGSLLIEADWSGIEAVLTGWCSGDPDYIRLSWLGVHDFLCSHAIHEPASLDWEIDDLLRFFKEIKEAHPVERDQCKRIVHGTNYLETVPGIYKRFRKLFPTLRDAQRLQDMYYEIAPKLRPWQRTTQDLAYEQEYLGGPGFHPFGYRHEFYNVRDFRQITEAQAIRRKRLGQPTSFMNGRHYAVEGGDDAKRAVAFFPQSLAAGVIRETSLRLFKPGMTDDYIGEAFFGRTPLRAIVHDSFLNEVPDGKVDWVIERLARQMTRAMEELPLPEEWGLGPYLQFGVEIKVGKDWNSMEKVKVPQPWLGVLKGDASGEVDLADHVPLDEVVDDEMEDAFGGEQYAF